jgi:hypothetical protein
MRPSILFASTLAALLGSSVAQAQFATPPPAARRPLLVASDEKPALLAITAEGGFVHSPQLPTGGYGRLGVQGLFGPGVKSPGLIGGIWEGFEGWGTRGMGGGSLAVLGLGGFKASSFLAMAGGGFNVLALDKATNDRRWAVGLFTPRATIRLGFHVDDVFFGFTGDVQRRYAWGRGGATLFQGGLAIGTMFDPVARKAQPVAE